MITLVLGGARSGKSRHAESLVAASGRPKLYLATSERMDAEMDARIARHREDRANAGWETIEEPLEIASILAGTAHAKHAILVDCLTLWLGNLMHYEKDIDTYGRSLIGALTASKAEIMLVSNEVGMGIVPETKIGRDFRDAAGILNQQVAAIARRVILMAAGCPLIMKG